MISAAALLHRFGEGGPVVTARAPGRVNLIGEHTDYNDGFVLPAILGFFVEVSVRRRADDQVNLLAIDLGESIEFILGDDIDPRWPRWAPYLAGLTEDLRKDGRVTGGFDLAVHGTVPRGSGLSSSAALETAAVLALEKLFEFSLEPLAMVRLCRDVEHRWAGVECGVMDQMASRLGRTGHALLIDCRDLSHRQVPLNLGGHSLVIVDSGVRRQLGESAYNARRRECEEGVAFIRKNDPAVVSLRDLEPGFHETLPAGLDQYVADRCRHVVEENARVLAAAEALAEGNLAGFGHLMNDSHESLRDLYDASHPVVDHLVTAAQNASGILGSRLTGAGWGGCTVTLCRTDALGDFTRRMEEVFAELGVPGSVLSPGPATASGIVEVDQ